MRELRANIFLLTLSFLFHFAFVFHVGSKIDLKNGLKAYLMMEHGNNHNESWEITDFGTDTYFDIAGKVATAVVEANNNNTADGPRAMGLLVCGTGMVRCKKMTTERTHVAVVFFI